jgi:hypothetical protein
MFDKTYPGDDHVDPAPPVSHPVAPAVASAPRPSVFAPPPRPVPAAVPAAASTRVPGAVVMPPILLNARTGGGIVHARATDGPGIWEMSG